MHLMLMGQTLPYVFPLELAERQAKARKAAMLRELRGDGVPDATPARPRRPLIPRLASALGLL